MTTGMKLGAIAILVGGIAIGYLVAENNSMRRNPVSPSSSAQPGGADPGERPSAVQDESTDDSAFDPKTEKPLLLQNLSNSNSPFLNLDLPKVINETNSFL